MRREKAESIGMAPEEDVRHDVRYRVGAWLRSRLPPGMFGVLLLASLGLPLATWLELARGGLDEPLGVELVMFLAWLLCALLAYSWWFYARQDAAGSGEGDSRRR